MRWIVNYFRSLFCKHDYELIEKVRWFDAGHYDIPAGYTNVYMCQCCGHVKKVRY